MPAVKLAPSILTADFGRLADQVREAEAGGADLLHLDIMDGQFVPPLTFGPVVVDALRNVTSLPFDIHLMIVDPDRQIDAFVEAAQTINVHVEATAHAHRMMQRIHNLDRRAGVCLNPATPLAAIEELLPDIDQVMVMTINPGWGGQPMLPGQLEKVRRLREAIDAGGHRAEIMIDGGVKVGNAAECAAAGADLLVCGSSVFNSESSAAENLAALRRAVLGG